MKSQSVRLGRTLTSRENEWLAVNLNKAFSDPER